jgi:predicted patatin/cPLA2 family phospholipase
VNLDTEGAAKLVGAMVLASGGIIAWVARIAENKGRKHAEKRLESTDTHANLNALVDQLQEEKKLWIEEKRQLQEEKKDLRAEIAEKVLEIKAQRDRADHYEDRYDKYTSEYRAKQLRETEERERAE